MREFLSIGVPYEVLMNGPPLELSLRGYLANNLNQNLYQMAMNF